MSAYKVCRDCDRVGRRGFMRHLLRSTDSDPVWVCASKRACDDRRYRRWMSVGEQ